MRRVVAAVILSLGAGCLGSSQFVCANDEQCTVGTTTGRCEANHACSLTDGSCASGFRWADGSPGAGTCVDATTPDGPLASDARECLVGRRLDAATDACAAAVCAVDNRCCAREWSDQCVQLTERLCARSCSERLATIGNGLVRVQRWTGTAFETIWSHAVHATTGFAAVAWGDVDADGRPDLVTCEEGGDVQIWRSAGTCGELLCPGQSAPVTDCADVEWVDADNDGDLDVLVVGAYWSGLWPNDQGLFGDLQDPLDGNYHAGVDFADVDEDGDLDLALAQYNTADQVLLAGRDGTGKVTYTPTAWVEPNGTSRSHVRVVFGDVDDDGRPDLLSTGLTFTQVWRNTSATSFATDATPLFETTAYGGLGAALADIDEDGDLDIVGVTDGGRVTLTRNQHSANTNGFTMTPLWQSADTFGPSRVAVGDVDGDRHLDLVVGTTPLTPATATSVFLGRPGAPWAFGTTANVANAVDADHAIVRDVALAPAW